MAAMDAEKTHKRVKIARKDWRYIASRFGGPPNDPKYFVINKVGTYGVAIAQFWWGRIAAILNRMLIAAGLYDWCFIYVDDFLVLWNLSHGQCEWGMAAGVMMFLLVLGFPFSWKKLRIGDILYREKTALTFHQ